MSDGKMMDDMSRSHHLMCQSSLPSSPIITSLMLGVHETQTLWLKYPHNDHSQYNDHFPMGVRILCQKKRSCLISICIWDGVSSPDTCDHQTWLFSGMSHNHSPDIKSIVLNHALIYPDTHDIPFWWYVMRWWWLLFYSVTGFISFSPYDTSGYLRK